MLFYVFYTVLVLKEMRTLPSLLQLHPVFNYLLHTLLLIIFLTELSSIKDKIQTKKRRILSDFGL